MAKQANGPTFTIPSYTADKERLVIPKNSLQRNQVLY